jgi:hypothetical protein
MIGRLYEGERRRLNRGSLLARDWLIACLLGGGVNSHPWWHSFYLATFDFAIGDLM